MTELRGVISAMVTPFTADGSAVDESALRDLTDRTIEGGVHGLLPEGSTGEFAAQTGEERRRVTEVVLDQARGRVPVVPHVGALSTAEAIALGRHAESAGAAAVLVVAPFYEPLEIGETKDYFRRVAGALSIPVILYNLPVATGVNLSVEDIVELVEDVPNIEYVKDTSGDYAQAARLIHDHGDVVKTLVGMDTFYLASLVEGGVGSINGAANLISPQLVQVYDDVVAGRVTEAKSTWDTIYPLMQFLVSGPYAAGVKASLEHLGHPVGEPRHPLAAVQGDRDTQLQSILKELTAAL